MTETIECELVLEQPCSASPTSEESTAVTPNILVGFSPIPMRKITTTTTEQEPTMQRLSGGDWSEAAEQTRLLSTPLLWEEPGTIMMECSDKGAFLWSDALGLYGKKVWDQCFVREANRWVAAVAMSLTPLDAAATTTSDSAPMRFEFKVFDSTRLDDATSRRMWASADGTILCAAKDNPMSPVVTLIERGCSATIL